MSKYLQIKNENQKKFDDFAKEHIYWIFAFSNKQFEEKLKEYDLTKDNIISIGAGGFIKKENKDLYLQEMNRLHDNDAFKQIINDDEEVKKAFIYELANHEYCITYDLDDTLDALNITRKELQEDARLALLLNKACEEYLSNSENL